MKTYLSVLFTVIMVSVYAQSAKQMETYLSNNWQSAAITYETGDTIQKLGQALKLRKNGEMIADLQGIKGKGSWHYFEASNSLELTVKMGEESHIIPIEIGTSTDNVLSLVQRNGTRTRTLIMVKEGSGIVYETVEAPELSFEDISEQSITNEMNDPELILEDEVIKEIDFNLELAIKADGTVERSQEAGILTLKENTDGDQKIVIIRGLNGTPQEWTVLEVIDEYGVMYHMCNLKNDLEGNEVNTKAKVNLNSSNVLFHFDDDSVTKYTIVEN